MQSQPPVSQRDSSTQRHYRDASRHSNLSSSQLTDDYTDTQMERDMDSILDEVTAARRSRANGSSHADGDSADSACRSRAKGSSSADGDSADSERPAKRQWASSFDDQGDAT